MPASSLSVSLAPKPQGATFLEIEKSHKLIPAFFAAGIYQLNVLVDTIFASFLVTGSPTWLYLSERLIQFPLGLFGVAVALVALPNMTELFLEKKMEELTLQSKKLLKKN